MKSIGIIYLTSAMFSLCLFSCTPAQPALEATLQNAVFQDFSVEQIPPRFLFIVTNIDDTYGFQAKTMLAASLSQNQYFKVVEQHTIEEAKNEAEVYNANLQYNGTTYIVNGIVSEHIRREGQTEYVKFDLHLVNPYFSLVVCSVHGEGMFIEQAINDAVNQMTKNVNTGTCRPMSFF